MTLFVQAEEELLCTIKSKMKYNKFLTQNQLIRTSKPSTNNRQLISHVSMFIFDNTWFTHWGRDAHSITRTPDKFTTISFPSSAPSIFTAFSSTTTPSLTSNPNSATSLKPPFPLTDKTSNEVSILRTTDPPSNPRPASQKDVNSPCAEFRPTVTRSNGYRFPIRCLTGAERDSDNICHTVQVIDMGIKDSNNRPFAARRKPFTAPERKATAEDFLFPFLASRVVLALT
ncbi:hypothetical protein MTR_1g083987 [Medicago truncatula]|uniref:Uncharacterized protein n=1 Tax=Medicago truncatula TaxID=3880 RepID=A0A072VN84_MEDTR|nr:hypothetical protein MTR_1g083987 [Medicago truncatula]